MIAAALAALALLPSGKLAQLDPLTLRPVGTTVALDGNVWGSAWSPDRRRLAIAVRRGSTTRIQVVDAARRRTTALVRITRRTWLPWVVWTPSGRVLAVGYARNGAHDVFSVDPDAGRVVRRTRVSGRVVFDDVVPAAGGAALLLAPRDGDGATTLATVSPDATVRRIALRGIVARLDGDQRFPALAADATRAFVVSATSPSVLAVDLATGTQALHPLGAQAAKDDRGAYRQATLLPGDALAIAGYDELSGVKRRVLGLRLVDTATWTTRVLDPHAAYYRAAPQGLLVGEGALGARTGLTAFGPDGSRRFAILRGKDVGIEAAGGYVYAHTYRPRHRTYVIDALTGRVVRVLRSAVVPRFL